MLVSINIVLFKGLKDLAITHENNFINAVTHHALVYRVKANEAASRDTSATSTCNTSGAPAVLGSICLQGQLHSR